MAWAALIVLAVLLWKLADVVLLVFGGIILATVLRAFARPLIGRLNLKPRLAMLVVVVSFTAALAGLGWLIGDRVAEQFDDIKRRLPDALRALVEWLNAQPFGRPLVAAWEGAKDGEVPWGRVVNAASMTFNALGGIVLIFFIGIYLAFDPMLYRNGALRLVPPAYRSRVEQAIDASGGALSRWLLGQGISMLFVGTATAIGLALMGMPLALSLGLIAGLLAFVPFFGPIAAGLFAVLFAFTQGPQQALYVAILAVAIQQVDDNLLMPIVQRWAVSLPPVLGIISAVTFGVLFGLAGVIFATPLMVVVMVLVQKLYVERLQESRLTSSATTRRDRAGARHSDC